MSDKKYVVPDGMLKAFNNSLDESMDGRQGWDQRDCHVALESAIRWLAENPVVPTEAQRYDMFEWMRNTGGGKDWNCLIEWQRRMFLAPESEVPDAVKDFLWGDWQRSHGVPDAVDGWLPIESHNAQVLEAYRCGKSGK